MYEYERKVNNVYMCKGDLMLTDLAKYLRDFEGVKRKSAIGPLVHSFYENTENSNILASFGEDAAVIDNGCDLLLMAADGIWSKLMVSDPRWSGYCAVLVNIHDIAAMGGRPIAMVDVFSVSKKSTCTLVSAGISEAVRKFNVPIVGGHIHPDTPYSALDIAILGTVKRDCVIYSSTAEVGDDIIMAVDLDGMVHPSSELNWDSTSQKDPQTLQKQIDSMRVLGESHLVNAGKDISNPGLIGTLGMLLEVSKKGAIVEVDKVPIPKDLNMENWLTIYPGMGFFVTARPENTEEIISIFEDHQLISARIGKITDGSILSITDGSECASVFDFKDGCITGLEC
ncbi:MAG: methanogenesis marker 2 protein [Halobacteriota archaeon]|nr:methanogenesis marker 2 protein [Halobacteriota archaeon]